MWFMTINLFFKLVIKFKQASIINSREQNVERSVATGDAGSNADRKINYFARFAFEVGDATSSTHIFSYSGFHGCFHRL